MLGDCEGAKKSYVSAVKTLFQKTPSDVHYNILMIKKKEKDITTADNQLS